jgi:hypothetical protein
MTPPIFATVDIAPVRALLKTGNGPLRFYMFGRAPQLPAAQPVYPYAVWQLAYGTPENYLGQRPDVDSLGVQVDVYASPAQGSAVARQVAVALRDALEGACYITAWRGESVDPETNNFRFGFDCDWIVPR